MVFYLPETIENATTLDDLTPRQIVTELDKYVVGQAAAKLTGDEKKALQEAYDQVEDEEDEHLYHTMGWTRELWLESLGLPAVLPPPEEEKDVKTAIGAARAKQARTEMLHGQKHKRAS